MYHLITKKYIQYAWDPLDLSHVFCYCLLQDVEGERHERVPRRGAVQRDDLRQRRLPTWSG